ncbi:MAG: BamA/TamA family outer membrane protein [Pedobacter sp.]|uniref:translocation and assembly module lipoprotein TamL n=1 Tax=Pedobacter sp. TaxID=1411316 RepID=UPI002809880E|nr:BamA/TamA family outer membrane protein [Pedobacter sp.]MDQ8005164.1 BamA/TamA family outer membrane protein [Pedobacter sp.]
MKAYKNYNKQDIQLLAILLFILVFIAGCASTKYIEDYQAIVKKVNIDSVDKEYEEAAYMYVQKDIKPVEGLGINVAIYNIFNTKDGKYRKTNIKPLGSPPPILDSTLVEISRTQIEKFFKSKGFFNTKVKSEIAVKDKKATLTFTASTGEPFMVNKITHEIPDQAVKSLYFSSKDKFSHLREGMQYDEDSLSTEREEIYKLMRQNGYYDFVRPYVRFSPDSNQNNNKVSVKLIIDEPLDSAINKHQIYKIGETNIIVAPNSDGFTDSLTLNKRSFNGLRYTDLSGKFRRNPITRYNFIRYGENYNIDNEALTYDRLYDLNIFKNVKIDYLKNKDTAGVVNPVILLIPQKRMSNRIEGEIPFNDATVGFTLSNTYTNNNFLRGGERFQLQVKGGLQSRFNSIGSLFSDIYQRDFSVSASLTVPRLMVPFKIPLMGKNGVPYTTFASSYLYALQKDITVRRIFINSITYDWVETKSKLHSFTPLNFEYRFGSVLIDDTNNLYSLLLLGRKDFTLGMKYAYALNADKLLQNRSFIYFRGNVDIAGNLLQGISKLTGDKNDPDNNDFGRVLGLPFNQYVRPEIDIRWYKNLGAESQLVTRLNTGIGHAYGNSRDMPFEKLFFAGGSSGVRAWQARTLGPGNYNREVIIDEQERASSFGIDQLGQMRIEANLEYRFPLVHKFFGGKLNAATFLDAGNIWNITPNNPRPESVFKFDKLGQQIALGTGLGFRYDVQFFVFRFDIGLKLKDPQFDGDEQWVIGKFINGGKAFKANYFSTHSPDRYRFMQYNFGIGMPF